MKELGLKVIEKIPCLKITVHASEQELFLSQASLFCDYDIALSRFSSVNQASRAEFSLVENNSAYLDDPFLRWPQTLTAVRSPAAVERARGYNCAVFNKKMTL